MKYIKDRFYNPHKSKLPTLRAPAQDLFTCEERTAFSCGLWVQRYDKFLKPPNFWRSFFSPIDFWVPKARIKKAPRSAIQASHHYRLRKRFDQLSSLPNSNHVSDTSDHPFFGVANAKVRQLFESTKFSEKFFFRAPRSCVLHLLYYIGSPSDALNIKNLLTTHEAQTLPKPRSFELRVQRYYNFSNPPNIKPTFFRANVRLPFRKSWFPCG